MNFFTALKHDFSVYMTKNYESSDKQISLISKESRYLKQWKCTTIEGKIYYPMIEWTSSIAMIATSFSTFSFLKSFCPFLRQPRFGTSVYNFTASPFNSDYVQMFHLVFHDGNQQSYHNNRKWHSILPSFQLNLYSKKKLENKTFSKASR